MTTHSLLTIPVRVGAEVPEFLRLDAPVRATLTAEVGGLVGGAMTSALYDEVAAA